MVATRKLLVLAAACLRLGACSAEAQEATPAAAGEAPAAGDATAATQVPAVLPAPQPPSSSEESTGSQAPPPVVMNVTLQAKQDLATIAAGDSSGSLRGAVSATAGWGHGIFGETCCMCSMHWGLRTVLYAAEDYTNFFGAHNAMWRCQHGCEEKCYRRGGHMFGCYDEDHLLQLDRMYGGRSNFQILHDEHFGNIC
eukprot:SRR837773.17214.p2 GENE.SRR837773.17214~~SRR837773.17214.p2  ORF type:complete len:212 (+),score=55.30 SRR837773.17214:47-637(+)